MAHGEVERECKLGEPGLLILKGPSITPGYVDPKYNEGLYTLDGWFKSGDLGRFDEDGYLWSRAARATSSSAAATTSSLR